MSAASNTAHRSLVSRLLEPYCEKHGLTLILLDEHGHGGHVETTSGRRWFFRGTHFDLNPLGASEISDDKAASLAALNKCGLLTPESLCLSGPVARAKETAHAFADEHGYPLFLKPNEGQEGLDVERLETRDDLTDSIDRLLARHRLLLLQRAVEGDDLRLLVLDGVVLCAVQRTPPALCGNGRTAIRDLMGEKLKKLLSDPRCQRELVRQGLTFDTVLEEGQKVRLLPNANLSAGGAGTLIMDVVPSTLADAAIKAAGCLNLRYAGIDLIAAPDGTYRILEVNAAPGLARLAAQGDMEKAVVADVYERVFDAMFS